MHDAPETKKPRIGGLVDYCTHYACYGQIHRDFSSTPASFLTPALVRNQLNLALFVMIWITGVGNVYALKAELR
jgi:hypothetical protein